MDLITRLTHILEPALHDIGYGLVRIQISGAIRKTMQVMIERLDNEGITIDDCARASREISAHLDVHDPFQEKYNLEVSSPGLERPLVKINDYKRFIGHNIVLKTIMPLSKRKNFQGCLEAADDREVHLKLSHPLDDGRNTIAISYTDIRSAHLEATI